MKFTTKHTLLFISLAALLIAASMANISLGSVLIPFSKTTSALFHTGNVEELYRQIIWSIRIPKLITAILCGAGLAVSGLQMQTFFRNPLAGPSILGVTAGGSFGVAFLLLGFQSAATIQTVQALGINQSWLLVFSSVVGSLCVMLLLMAISTRIYDSVTLLVIGLMIANITLAVVGLWQYFSHPEQLQDYILWTFGSLGGVTQNQLSVFACMIGVGLVMSIFLSKPLDQLLLGETYARSMGLNVKRTRFLIIICSCILAGTVTAFCGPIGFVGIAVPHLAKGLLKQTAHRYLFWVTLLVGAIVLVLCDIVAQLPSFSIALPINAVTALIGSPVVIWVVLKRKKLSRK